MNYDDHNDQVVSRLLNDPRINLGREDLLQILNQKKEVQIAPGGAARTLTAGAVALKGMPASAAVPGERPKMGKPQPKANASTSAPSTKNSHSEVQILSAEQLPDSWAARSTMVPTRFTKVPHMFLACKSVLTASPAYGLLTNK